MDDTNTSITRVLSIVQDITYAASKGKKLTPKHIGLCLALHQAARCKTMVQLFHASGHTISYERVLRVDTSIAQHQIDRFVANIHTY